MNDVVERLNWRVERHRTLAGNYSYYSETDARLDEGAIAEITRLRLAMFGVGLVALLLAGLVRWAGGW